MERVQREYQRARQSDVLRWTAKGAICGGLYGTLMALQHGLIGTRTCRTMILKSAFIIGVSAGVFPLSSQLYRQVTDAPSGHLEVREGAVAGCASGVAMGVLMGRWQAAAGSCLAGASLGGFSALMVNYKDVKMTDHPMDATTGPSRS